MTLTPSEWLYIVRSRFAEPGREGAWSEWYSEVHVPEMLSVPGVLSATRYADVRQNGEYLAFYDIESPTVFEDSRYAEVTGWHEWHPYVSEWRRTIARRSGPDETHLGGARKLHP